MYTTDDIREIDFSTSMSGYKKSEVDDFLDQLADDYEQLVNENKQLKEQLKKGAASAPVADKPATPAEPDLATTENVQSILTSAQRFSDQLIFEAKQKAEALLTDAAIKAKEIKDKIAADKAQVEEHIAKSKEEAEQTVTTVLKGANDKSESIVLAAKDSVERQQMLFDKLRVEADLFKSKLVEGYKKQLELLAEFPIEVPFDAVHASKAVEFIIDNKPDFNSFINQEAKGEPETAQPAEPAEEAPAVTEETAEEEYAEPAEPEYEDPDDNQYVIEDKAEEENEESQEDSMELPAEEKEEDDGKDKKGFMYLFKDED